MVAQHLARGHGLGGVLLVAGIVGMTATTWAEAPAAPPDPALAAAGGARPPLQEAASLAPPGSPASAQEGWKEFFRQRTQAGVGIVERYDSNVFLTRSAQRQADLKTILESKLQFADPRGDWLYGGNYALHGFRHHNINQNGLDHQFLGYLHYTPLARYSVTLTNAYEIQGRLVEGLQEADVIRRFAKVKYVTTDNFGLKGTYDLNPTNALHLEYAWSMRDDTAPDRNNVNNFVHKVTAGMDHDLSRRWTVFGGYLFEDTTFPKAPTKDAQRHGVELGTQYDVDPLTTIKVTTDVTERLPANGDTSIKADFEAAITRLLSPNTSWALTLTQTHPSSSSSTAQTYKKDRLKLSVKHELTPRVALNWAGTYEQLRTSAPAVDHNYEFLTQFAWQVRQNVVAYLEYQFREVSTRQHIAEHAVEFTVEVQLW